MTDMPTSWRLEQARREQVTVIEGLVQQAVAADWQVRYRPGGLYFRAVRVRGHVTQQVSAAIFGGILRANYTETIGDTETSEQVVRWLNEGR